MVFPHNRSIQRRPRMKLHRNAKTTPSSRLLLGAPRPVRGLELCRGGRGFAVSVRTVAKWVRRFREGGVAALEDGSSRPGAPPHQTPPARGRADSGPAPAARAAGVGDRPGAATSRGRRSSAWLRRLGLNRPAGARRRCPCSATSGRRPAICCTSISSRSGASTGSGIASMAIAAAHARRRLGVRARRDR